MLKRGLATVYEAKIGSEFGGDKMEKKYRKAEWWASDSCTPSDFPNQTRRDDNPSKAPWLAS
jgi:hypothetical protein